MFRVQLKHEVQTERTEREGTDTRLRAVLEAKEQVEREKVQIAREKDEVVKKNTAILAKIHKVEEDKNQLHTQVLETEEVLGGFKDEAEKTMEDYHKIAAQLQELTEENKKNIALKSKYFNELSRRTEEVKKKGGELESKDEELVRKDKELKDKMEQSEEKLKAQESVMQQQVRV